MKTQAELSARSELSVREALEELRKSVKWCPLHHKTDCSPLLNGCPRLMRQADALDVLGELVRAAENSGV